VAVDHGYYYIHVFESHDSTVRRHYIERRAFRNLEIMITLIAGGAEGQSDGLNDKAGFLQPARIWIGKDCLFVYDHDRIRKIV